MKISYAITCCNELAEIQRLISQLLKHKRSEDNIVVLFDKTNGSKLVEEYLRAKSVKGEFQWYPYGFDGHFANMKNKLSSHCSGDYIVNIDADEMVDEYFIKIIPQVLEVNKVDVVLVPRINTVSNLGLSHAQKWGWNISKLETQIDEKEFDLTNPQDLDEYNLLKQNGLIIKEYS